MIFQDEESLLCRVATSHSPSEGLQLINTPGWATLVTILQESGERPPKRPWPPAEPSRTSSQDSQIRKRRNPQPSNLPRSISASPESEQLAKRFKGASLE